MTSFLLLVLLILTQVLGDIWLSRGMKLFGHITSYSPESLLNLARYLFTSPWIVLGVITLLSSLVFYMLAISRLDLSYVLPVQVFSYVLNAVLAWLILKEDVSGLRWLATIIIAFGVLIVTWTEVIQPSRISSENKRDINPLLFLFPVGFSLPKVVLGALFWSLSDGIGDLLIAYGTKRMGEPYLRSPSKLLRWIGNLLINPFILLGVCCYTLSFVTFLSLLSWNDISLVRPLTAVTYAISLLGAKYILKERIHQGRLIGIVIIGCGMILVSLT